MFQLQLEFLCQSTAVLTCLVWHASSWLLLCWRLRLATRAQWQLMHGGQGQQCQQQVERQRLLRKSVAEICDAGAMCVWLFAAGWRPPTGRPCVTRSGGRRRPFNLWPLIAARVRPLTWVSWPAGAYPASSAPTNHSFASTASVERLGTRGYPTGGSDAGAVGWHAQLC